MTGRERGLRQAADRLGLTLVASETRGRYRLIDAWGETITACDLDLDAAEFYIGHEPVHRCRVEAFTATARADHPTILDETLWRIDASHPKS